MPEEPVPPLPESTDAKTMVKKFLLGSIKPLFFILLGIAVFWFLSSQIRGNALLGQLRDASAARGLITFVVATSTIAGAIILVLAAIISDGTENDIKMRLSEARQVLAPLIGILGTVVGFYFGQAPVTGQPAAATAQTQTLRVGAATSSPEQVAPGGAVIVRSPVSGGRPPYEYTITLSGVGQPVAGKLAEEGEIKQEVTIPKEAKPQSVTIQPAVKDSAGTSAEAKSERPLKLGGS